MTWAQLVAAAEEVRDAAGAGLEGDRLAAPAAPAGRRIAGIGWATVDLERAQGELDGLLAGDPAAPSLQPWARLDRDPDLGASAWMRAPSDWVGSSSDVATTPAPALVVLEPDTEGRLAASLARFGEGVLVIYLGPGLPRAGRLLPGGPAWGPHVVRLDPDERGRS